MYRRFEHLLAQAQHRAERQAQDLPLQKVLEPLVAGSGLERDQLDFLISTVIEHEYAASPDTLSAYYWQADQGFEGSDALFPGGYDWLPQKLAAGLPIQFQRQVKRIRYTAQGVTVETDQGSVQAAAAIVTVPLGVLQQGGLIFDPPLPAAKQQSIQKLHMGTLQKVYLLFPEVFWDPAATWLGILGDEAGQALSIVPRFSDNRFCWDSTVVEPGLAWSL